MPSSILYGISNEGKVHTLSTSGSMWKEIPYTGLNFKKLSVVPHFLWALGVDHQIYLYVHGLDIPIKVREESYENERWIPIEGFSTRLLPTDRYRFSNADGTVERSTDKIRLPSRAWQWEGDWQLELTLNGQPLDHNGWTYALDFPATYYPNKQWKSYVRRRLWVRTRRYAGMNSWCIIAPLHEDATQEPFIDISVGGQRLIGAAPGTMLVWAVTSHNRVMFRAGVSTTSPEGVRWDSVQTPVGCEVNQINVGPTGLVWAALLDGRALVRIGVTRDTLSGTTWVEVRCPGENSRISQIAVGTNSVWVVTHKKGVWFRQGVKGEGCEITEEMAIGTGWVEMVDNMALISLTENDQVFAIGANDRLVYYRVGVNGCDLTGKRWKALHAPLQVSRASSNASLSKDRFPRSLNALQSRPSSMVETTTIHEWDDQPHSAPTARFSLPAGDCRFETQPKSTKLWTLNNSVGSVMGMEAQETGDESLWLDGSRDSCVFSEDEELGWAEYEAPWAWMDAGACTIDPSQWPNWFAEVNTVTYQAEIESLWRIKILRELKSRTALLAEKFADYELAVESKSYVHTTEAMVNLGGSFVDCILQLEWIDINGTLTVLNPDGGNIMNLFSLSDATCIQCCSEPGNPRLAIHLPRHNPSQIRLQFTNDAQMEEWHTHFALLCNKIHENTEKPSDQSVWVTTSLGDIFVWDPTRLESNQLREDECYMQKYDLSNKESPIKVALNVGCIPGTIIILTGCVADDAERLGINLDAPSTYKLRHKTYTDNENTCLHFNPRLTDNCIVRNTLIDGKWGVEERDGSCPLQKGQVFCLKILTTEDAFIIYINDHLFTKYRHRLPPNSANMLSIWGRMQPYKLVIKSPEIVLDAQMLYWRQLGGHLRRVESCHIGVVWGVGYDHTVWVYTGGWGGGFFPPLDSFNVRNMIDSQDYRVYENQRWNPVSGYTSTGLPTDRYMWSDATGKQKRTREQVKLLSSKWQWTGDWLVDFHVPGGADREGWQYAIDFPSTYHAKKRMMDYVRRRRWYRRCTISTTGPWQELMGQTKLLDVSLEPIKDDLDSFIVVWAVAVGGQAVFREGVTRANPSGTNWEHINCDQNLVSISCGPYKQVWAVGVKGGAFWRLGITDNHLKGHKWMSIEPPNGSELKQISCNTIGIWAIDQIGKLWFRKDVTHVLPEGNHWQAISIDPPLLNSASNTKGFKHVSVGRKEVWIVTDGGVIARRIGICTNHPEGFGWSIGIPGKFQYVCVRAFN